MIEFDKKDVIKMIKELSIAQETAERCCHCTQYINHIDVQNRGRLMAEKIHKVRDLMCSSIEYEVVG